MATTTNKGQGIDKLLVVKELHLNKWQRFDEFTKELQPIIDQLNGLMAKYSIAIDNFILFPVNKNTNKIEPYINYEAFPSSVSSNAQGTFE